MHEKILTVSSVHTLVLYLVPEQLIEMLILTVSSVHTTVLYLVPEQLIEKRMQCIELFIGVNSQLCIS